MARRIGSVLWCQVMEDGLHADQLGRSGVIWVVACIGFVGYASGPFISSASHGRHWAAIGILLSATGFQLAVLETINAGVGITIAVIGLGCVGRDLAVAVGPRVVTALARPGRDSASDIG